MAKKTAFKTIANKKHPQYWKVKAAFLQWAATAEARAMVAEASKALTAAMLEAGLDPQKTYTLNDADETITLQH